MPDDHTLTSGGIESMRVTSQLAPGEAARLAARDEAARRSLAAFALEACPPGRRGDVSAAQDWYHDIAEMLGLVDERPQRKPGTCLVCGGRLPVGFAAGRRIKAQKRLDICTKKACQKAVSDA